MSKFTLAPPPHILKDKPYALNWVNLLIKRVSDATQIDWDQFDLSESDHDGLQGRHEVDGTDTDTERNKHVSNNDIKLTVDHSAATSAHGSTGSIVGTSDYATTLVGGTVLKGVAVSDAVASTISVTSTDAGLLYTSAEQTLINELKTDVNSLVTDLNSAITQLNALIASMQTAKQIT